MLASESALAPASASFPVAPSVGLLALHPQTQASCKERSLRRLLRSRAPGPVARPSPPPRTRGAPGLPPAWSAGPPAAEATVRGCRVCPLASARCSPLPWRAGPCRLLSALLARGVELFLSFALVCLRCGEYFINKCICIVPFLLESTYKQYPIVLVFLWLADFTYCDNL